jgi:hypothetical protein
MLSDARLQEIAAVEAAATPGPWDVIAHSAGHPQLLTVADAHSPICDVVRSYPYNHQANAAFIADARQAVPELLAEVARLRAVEARAIHFALRGRGVPLPYPLASEGET